MPGILSLLLFYARMSIRASWQRTSRYARQLSQVITRALSGERILALGAILPFRAKSTRDISGILRACQFVQVNGSHEDIRRACAMRQTRQVGMPRNTFPAYQVGAPKQSPPLSCVTIADFRGSRNFFLSRHPLRRTAP